MPEQEDRGGGSYNKHITIENSPARVLQSQQEDQALAMCSHPSLSDMCLGAAGKPSCRLYNHRATGKAKYYMNGKQIHMSGVWCMLNNPIHALPVSLGMARTSFMISDSLSPTTATG
ncbi:hypothetical protein JI435_405250 [Parastagonospora nodorum SN15]|uniref:Uncharacterized protein n=1 Tax=Phaeosphaeria nodorum (strain SN15 / ATCC MYA-4574 / FGSC 10173) TaxID=321614 RepID=A0A7U2EYA2_PHANO|nr:hypothetical protein JI435_405250 [Parastagonospora nodorum SN15]